MPRPKKGTEIIIPEEQDKSLANKSEAEILIARAIDRNVPVETMEKLLAMRRELKAEKAKEEYDTAMAKFQSECPIIEKTKEVKTNTGAVAYKYAPIESIVNQVKEALKNNGFSYSTNMKLLEDGVSVTVKVTHSLGHSELTEMTVPFGNKTNVMSQTQVVAAAQTFAKRYAFCNAFGILTGDEDTDAKETQQEQKEKQAVQGIRMATENQLKYICTLLPMKGKKKEDLYSYYKITTLNSLTFGQASAIIERLNKMSSVAQKPQESPKTDENQAPKGEDGNVEPYPWSENLKNEDVDPNEASAGIEEMKKQEKKEFNPPAEKFQVAWVKAVLPQLLEHGIVDSSVELPMFDFMSKKEYQRIKGEYDLKIGLKK